MDLTKEIDSFEEYLCDVKKSSYNTRISYKRDLNKVVTYLQNKGIEDASFVRMQDLDEYVAKMREDNLSAATVSRNIAAIRSFFAFLFTNGQIKEDPTAGLRAPAVEKKVPDILSVDEVESLLEQPNKQTIKGMRDLAMLELLYGTGIRVSELISLKVKDVDMTKSCITCTDGSKKRVIPFGILAKQSLRLYLEHSRPLFVNDKKSDYLFTNVSGGSMSRQGFWKLLKACAADAGITKNITPHTLRHSFSAHMLANGADEKAVGVMLGLAESAPKADQPKVDLRKLRSVHKKNHPRG